MAEEKIPVLAVVGPTASGKTSLAVHLADKLNGEIVSADSMQVYREMNIATAAPTEDETGNIPYHLVNFVSPEERFSVASYVTLAADVIRDIHSRGKLSIVAGGTGLYIQNLLDNVILTPGKTDLELRGKLQKKAEELGAQTLLDELNKIDPETAERLHPNNTGRIIRALELFYSTGITMSEQIKRSREQPSPYSPLFIGLACRDRDFLYNRINLRVDEMVKSGLLEEAKSFLQSHHGGTSVQAIGYKELAPYFEGTLSLQDALENLKRETRRYAKRQLTWFRRDDRINWFYLDDYKNNEELCDCVEEFVKSKL